MVAVREEGIALRPFSGVDALERTLQEMVHLRVTTGVTSTTIGHSQAFAFEKDELLHCGLQIVLNDVNEITKAALPLVQNDDDIDWVVVAEDGVRAAVRGSQIVRTGSISELPDEIEIAKAAEPNSGLVLGHPHASRTIKFLLVHNKNTDTTSSTKPRTKGAILGVITFDLLIQPAQETLQPIPLSDELRKEFNIDQNSWFFFKTEAEDMLDSQTLDGAFRFYIDDQMLRKYSGAARPIRESFQWMLYGLVVTNLILNVHSILKSEEAATITATSAINRLFQSVFSKSKDFRDNWPEKISQNPQAALSKALASGGAASKIVALLESTEEEEQDEND